MSLINFFSTDELRLFDEDGKEVPVIRTGIAWPSDKEIKFRNPEGDLKTGTNR